MKRFLGILTVALCVGLTSLAMAKEQGGKKVKLNASIGISDTLKQAQSAKMSVTVYLRGGEKLQGKVADVSSSQVVLAELANRDFYDALVLIADISAIEVRAREE